jgi:DtxR family Mn-dependent transcriptional regulator
MDALSASLEDYLEAIWILGLAGNEVRVKNIGELLDVKNPSVVGALKTLSERDLVTHERYGYVELTGQGATLAREVYRKHRTLAEFFNKVLGVDIDTATQDACAVEHHVSRDTLDRIALFVEFAEGHSNEESPCLERFQSYLKENWKSGQVQNEKENS